MISPSRHNIAFSRQLRIYANLLTKPRQLWFLSARALIAQIFYFELLKTNTQASSQCSSRFDT